MNEEEFVPGKWITHKWGVDYGNHQDFFLISIPNPISTETKPSKFPIL